jgi:hypothetical protein
MNKVKQYIQDRIEQINKEITGKSLAEWTVGIAKISELRNVLTLIDHEQNPWKRADLPETARVYVLDGPGPEVRFS